MKFTVLTPALCALAAAVPLNVEVPAKVDAGGALDPATGAVNVDAPVEVSEEARDLDFDSTLFEADTPVTVGEGLFDRVNNDGDTKADAGILDLKAPVDILPASDKRDDPVEVGVDVDLPFDDPNEAYLNARQDEGDGPGEPDGGEDDGFAVDLEANVDVDGEPDDGGEGGVDVDVNTGANVPDVADVDVEVGADDFEH